MINADMEEQTSHRATINVHGPAGVSGKDQRTRALPTASPGKLHYSKAAQKAAFAECRLAVADHDSCVFQLHARGKLY